MMLSSLDVGSFFVRIKEYMPFPDIEGKVIYLRGVSSDRVEISFTDDCKPMDKVYALPLDVNDNGWYNVTPMIMMANMCILPKYDKCVFDNEVAMNYRNHLDRIPKPVDESQASNGIYLLGSSNNRVISFSKQAYYIVSSDVQGYILAYSGFCQPLEEWEKPKLQQRVLRLVGTSRKLYPAEPIVNACNQAYHADFEQAMSYANTIRDTVAASSVGDNAASEIFTRGINRLKLT